MAITEAGGGYTPIMARPGLPTRGATGATAHETSLIHSSR